MRINYLYVLFFFLLHTVMSCDRIGEVDVPFFNVKTNKDIYKVGDSVRFIFEGNPDIISFYSGELGHDYDYINGRTVKPDYLINFETQSQNGEQANQMRILVSKNFDADYSIEGVHRAEWVDITSRFSMAPPSNGSSYVPSGLFGFNDLLDDNLDTTKLYFAVKQIVLNQNVHGLGNLNRLRYFTISSDYESLHSKLYQHADFGWQLFSTPNKQPDRAALDNSYTIMMRNSWWTSPENYYLRDTEDWAVSTQLSIPKILDLGVDRAISIKGISDILVNEYTYIFNEPGVYKLVFKAINVNVNNQKENIKEIVITVTN